MVTLCSFKPRLIRQRYTERRRLAAEYMGSNTHTYTHQRTQLSIVTNIIEREFVATAIILSSNGNTQQAACYSREVVAHGASITWYLVDFTYDQYCYV